jgi:hypothetical protein
MVAKIFTNPFSAEEAIRIVVALEKTNLHSKSIEFHLIPY